MCVSSVSCISELCSGEELTYSVKFKRSDRSIYIQEWIWNAQKPAEISPNCYFFLFLSSKTCKGHVKYVPLQPCLKEHKFWNKCQISYTRCSKITVKSSAKMCVKKTVIVWQSSTKAKQDIHRDYLSLALQDPICQSIPSLENISSPESQWKRAQS